MLHIYVDADACPVKEEVYRVAQRYGLEVTLVANSWMRTPNYHWLRLVVVKDDKLDAADDWIAEQAGEGDIVVTADIPLASRCLKNGALVTGCTGREFREDTIGDALASRELMSELRESGFQMGGPPPFQKKDRSRFLQKLDEMIQRVRRSQS
ncbi:YaiI/YqxD family protein [Chitinispirillales bacterium ANBcel5]|uniref:YaiI/YqxD family protein n=1 Tax=Cellulosispirillum alkaliphilum TaxID=3039283 RepID=UPI002A4F94F1|nr:YaiI/YqxD family protein [Chitinispirillales bacterium ANBcel5]